MALKLHRNHLSQSSQKSLCGVLSDISVGRRGYTADGMNGLSASLWASQRTRRYRYGIINAVFNPRKVLLGDDPELHDDDDGRSRDWLDR